MTWAVPSPTPNGSGDTDGSPVRHWSLPFGVVRSSLNVSQLKQWRHIFIGGRNNCDLVEWMKAEVPSRGSRCCIVQVWGVKQASLDYNLTFVH